MHRPHHTRIAALLLAAGGLAVCAWWPAGAAPASAPPPSLARMVGQKLVVSMDGTTPSVSLLRRARTGRIGGVIIHGYNFSGAAGLRAIAQKLQAAAAAGGRPPLLIAVDQEGGPVKTVPWIPPTVSPRRMGELGSTVRATRQGRKTAAALLDLGINVDFGPVADVPVSTASFMYLQGRTWSFDATRTARLSDAFAVGLGERHVVATMKHFPGIGRAKKNTDSNVVRISAPKTRLAPGLLPYRRAVASHVPLIMLSNAVYDAYDRYNAAGWSRAIGNGLLRNELGYRGATITDSLTGTAHARGVPEAKLALRAARAGTDFILVTGSESSTRGVYRSLLAAAQAGTVGPARLAASYERIVRLKATL